MYRPALQKFNPALGPWKQSRVIMIKSDLIEILILCNIDQYRKSGINCVLLQLTWFFWIVIFNDASLLLTLPMINIIIVSRYLLTTFSPCLSLVLTFSFTYIWHRCAKRYVKYDLEIIFSENSIYFQIDFLSFSSHKILKEGQNSESGKTFGRVSRYFQIY